MQKAKHFADPVEKKGQSDRGPAIGQHHRLISQPQPSLQAASAMKPSGEALTDRVEAPAVNESCEDMTRVGEVICATEPNAYLDKDLDGMDLLRDDIEDGDGEELLTVNLTPKNQTTKFERSKF